MTDERDFQSDDRQLESEDIQFEEEVISGSDSGILQVTPLDPELLKITEDGNRINIEFNSDHLIDDLCIASYREQVHSMLEKSDCKNVQIDLTNVKIIPSGMLGLIAGMKNRGYGVDLVNPSPDIREILKVTKLDEVLTIHKPAE